ncbi:hypothetical protein CRE_30801 [Caenorhabditis remanei]|uniref:Uncharacterized protein n=1 Tax=Caenorhabditis remanei TaxID=31234 RepID=E3LUC7_CAERE|nr:hypothetical protein CRE_30801 [Caenorhabditis remanei]
MTLKPSSETFLFFIFYTICCVSSSENVEFPCQILDPLLFRINSTIYVPQNSSAPFAISANFTCTYPFFVQKNEYLRLSVINSLLDKDVIEFVDSVGYRRNLTVQSIANDELFATFGHGHVRIITGPQGRSRALLVFQWLEMPDSNWSEKLHKNESGQNVDCMDIQQKAITFTAVDDKERIALSIAHSGYVFDRFDSYFIFDGPDTSSPVVGRMSSHVVVPFISSNQSVTVIGLTKQVVYSNVIANIQSNIAGYRKYQAAVVIDQYGGQLDSINQTIAVTFIAKDANQLYITMLRFYEDRWSDTCEMKIISGSPSPISKHLLTYTPSSELDMLFPQQFPTSQVTVELTDCSVYMVLSKNTPANFYMVGDDERMGYVFTPSFLDGQATPDWNFTLSSNQSCHFSTTVESVTIYNEQVLAITVYNEKGYSAMSTVITGNETGGAAEGIGTSVNMNLFGSKGQGQAKIRYHISKISERITGVSILALLALWTIW